jgi:hypothetical protein
MNIIWLTKLLLAHFLTDFALQPKKWIDQRNQKHFSSGYLYLHATVTAVFAGTFVGWQYWKIAIVIFITHLVIDGWKSYQKQSIVYFLIDQFLHLLVIFGSWYFIFGKPADLSTWWKDVNSDVNFWIILAAVVFLTAPSAILIGQLTQYWRNQLEQEADTLANAGKWIGIFERIIILVLVLQNQYEAIGLLVAAKTILRFSENSRTEVKTEYLLIGTLISIALAIAVGLLVIKLSH